MKSKNILFNNSKLIFNGLIKINDQAFNSEGYQKSESLTLSDNNEVSSIPKLEIFSINL